MTPSKKCIHKFTEWASIGKRVCTEKRKCVKCGIEQVKAVKSKFNWRVR